MLVKLNQRTGLMLAILATAALWLTGLNYPIVSDTAIYAVLGENFWQTGTYKLFGQLYAKHLPLHAITSYPLVWLFDYGLGMKLASLLAGIAMLLAVYAIGKRQFSAPVAQLAVWGVVLHHAFAWITIVGSADLLFSALILWGIYCYLKAEEDPQWYLTAGLLLGLGCLTRYNGVPMIALYFVYAFIWRPNDFKKHIFWWGGVAAAALFASWLVRNFITFGDPLFTSYTGELQKESDGPLAQIWSNLIYYGNPLHNVLPVFLVAGLYGTFKKWREQPFLILSMLALWALTAIWWVQAIRFGWVGFVILIMFGAWGLLMLWQRYGSKLLLSLGVLVVIAHGGMICLYSSGQCNAWADSTFSFIPKHLGLTSEGFYANQTAREYINSSANPDDYVLVDGDLQLAVQGEGVYRADLKLGNAEADQGECPAYSLTALRDSTTIYTTSTVPKVAVYFRDCP